jgi:hypothetical protein
MYGEIMKNKKLTKKQSEKLGDFVITYQSMVEQVASDMVLSADMSKTPIRAILDEFMGGFKNDVGKILKETKYGEIDSSIGE